MRANYEVTIGIEVHVQLDTKSKIFCACPVRQSETPNSTICPVCTGHPGTLPVLNEKVITYAIMAGLGTHCTINKQSVFARKHYFYPDLPKNYQITQNDLPVCTEGYIAIKREDGTEKKVRLIRIHIEEDAGKNVHSPQSSESFVDLNRAGTPLLEIVSYPDISSAYEARTYLKALHTIVTHLGICSGNMEEGAFRADTNVSVKKKGAEKLGTRCELKNINSFKFINDAVEYEIDRQIAILEAGEKVIQETRSWDTKEQRTFSLRTKEEAADYRYFPDPDLPPLILDDATIAAIKSTLPELPDAQFARFMQDYGISEYEADILVHDRPLAWYFEEARKHTRSKLLINWVLRDILKLSKEQKVSPRECSIKPQRLAELVALIDAGIINTAVAQKLFEELTTLDVSPTQLVKERGLEQVGSVEELEAIVKEIIAANPQQVADYRSGKDKLFGFFVGAAMKKTQGKANTQLLNELFKKHL